ncbi:MAG: ribosome recycling factor [Deltaproteobacteria bacterium]|nr:MAG: ribosome recycling factor [Deltaproteobacteria bacterium]
MIDEATELAQEGMEKALDRLRRELGRVRTGRANPAMLDEVRVDAYGATMPLKQVATVTVADARLLVVKPFDRNTIPAIEKAIGAAGLGLNPQNDGVVVRVPVPALTEERRKALVKQVHDLGEEAKIAIRQARREANELLKSAAKDKEISEDDLERGKNAVQKLTDRFVADVDAAVSAREAEILEG